MANENDRTGNPEVPKNVRSVSLRSVNHLSGSGWLLFLSAGLLAGILTTVCVHTFHDSFEVPPEVVALSGKMNLNPHEEALSHAAIESLNRNRSVMAIGLFGVFTGAMLGLAAGLTPGGRRTPITGLALGTLLGGGFGALAGIAGYVAKSYLNAVTEDEMLRIIGMHSAFWVIAGIGIGLAVGLTRGTKMAVPANLLAAVMGGCLAAAIYSPLAAMLFPVESGDTVVPQSFGSRLLWATLAAVSIAVLLARSVGANQAQPAAEQERMSTA